MADYVIRQKYVGKNVAKAHGKVATFMPTPLFGDNGSGMHTHQSLWRDGTNLFYDADSSYGLISATCRHYIGGLLKHAPALLAFIAPTTNSYRRLAPGCAAPVSLVYSTRNRSPGARIPAYSRPPAPLLHHTRPRAPWRVGPASAAGAPTRTRGWSRKGTVGGWRGSPRSMKRVIFSAASASIAPPLVIGSLAITLTG